jgi:hypothetical protein
MNSSNSSLVRHPLFLLVGCCALALASGAAAAPPAAPGAAGATPAGSPAATAPDAAKTRQHLQAHVKYPASREQVLAACADTPEFSAGEKQWLASHLPAGNYASAAAVIAALKI